MRQRSAKIILLCTGILMLVLSVLPHHHHCDGTIRFSVADNCIECRHNTADKHSHPENDATCDLRQLFIMSEHPNDKSHLYCLCHSHDQHTSDCFLFAHLYFICITTSTITLIFPNLHGNMYQALHFQMRCKFMRSQHYVLLLHS